MAPAIRYDDAKDLLSPAVSAQVVAPSDSVELKYQTRALWVGVGGNVAVTMANGEDVTFVAVPAGSMLPVAVTKVKATGTTATSILALD